jgi:hypothetical protein
VLPATFGKEAFFLPFVFGAFVKNQVGIAA